MFAGIYYGAMYGGSTTTILLNTPGESSSIATALEGNLMARAGRASQALATAAIGSFIAGTIGTLLVAWAQRGEADTLLPLLETKPSWQEGGWPILAQLWAKAGRTKEALQLATGHLPPPTLPDDPCPPNQAESRWYRSPRDYGAAFVLAETRRKNGDLVGARVVLEKITERPEAPAYFWWLRSRVETEEGRFAPAWESLRKYLEKAVPGWPSV